VGSAEQGQLLLAGGGQGEPHESPVVVVDAVADDEAELLGAVDELDGTVVADAEVVGELSDARSAAVRMASNREEQLVLGSGEADRLSLLPAPLEEPAQADTQREQCRVVLVTKVCEPTHQADNS